jgi:tetratricopeptide (TPR) repeat protein
MSRSKLEYLQDKKLSPADELREKLTSLEESLLIIKSMDSAQALALLHDLDGVDTQIDQFEANGLDLRSERGRFETVQGRLKNTAKPLLKAVGGPTVLRQHRSTPAPPSEQWWWYIDEIVMAQRQRALKRLMIGLAIVVLLIGGVVLAFSTILAPSPEAVARLKAVNSALFAVDEGSYREALSYIEEGLAKVPDNPELLIFKGTLHQLLGEEAKADQSFVQAQEILNNPLDFYQLRAQLYLQLNQPEQAERDAQTVLELDENVSRAWLFLAQAFEIQGKRVEAIQAYETASELASEQGENEVYVLARMALGQLGQVVPMPGSQETLTPSIDDNETAE